MSEKATQRTLDLMNETVPPVFYGHIDSESRWSAVEELTAKSKELAAAEEVDHEAITEMARDTANFAGLDFEGASTVLDVVMKIGLADNRNDPITNYERVWMGTGTGISFLQDEPVHYFNKPGYVEAKYGPGFPYIMAKTGWMAYLAHQGYEAMDNRGGYQEITRKLRESGAIAANALPHIGAVAMREHIDHLGPGPLYISSTSGVLPMPWVHQAYSEAGFAERELEDQPLLDGFPLNLRAGLYDAEYGQMVLAALKGDRNSGKLFVPPSPALYEGVDIN